MLITEAAEYKPRQTCLQTDLWLCPFAPITMYSVAVAHLPFTPNENRRIPQAPKVAQISSGSNVSLKLDCGERTRNRDKFPLDFHIFTQSKLLWAIILEENLRVDLFYEWADVGSP